MQIDGLFIHLRSHMTYSTPFVRPFTVHVDADVSQVPINAPASILRAIIS